MKAFVGHPVDVVTGAVFTAWNDFQFKGRTALSWRRFYSTASPECTALGRGWTTPYFSRIEHREGMVVVTGDEGHAHAFESPADGSVSSLPMHRLSLKRTPSGYIVFDGSRSQYWHYTEDRAHPGRYTLNQIEELTGHSIYLRHDDADGRLLEMEQRSLGRRIAFVHDKAGLIVAADLLIAGFKPARLVSYGYDADRRLIEAQDPSGGRIRYDYDQQHRMVRETNKLGASFHFEYDRDGRCVHTWGDGGYLRRKLKYLPKRRTTLVTDSLGATTSYLHTSDGRISAVTDALGRRVKYLYLGGIEQRVSASGRVTESEVNERGELVRRTNGLGQSFLFVYNARSQVATITDPGGAVWNRRYDDRGLLVALADHLGNEWRFERASSGEIVKQIDPEGRELRRRYDPLMRWQEISNEVGYYRCEYDPAGRPIIAANPEGLIATWAYDASGRLIRTSHRDKTSETREYDAGGNVIARCDANGGRWTFTYNAFNRPVGARDPLGNEIHVEYDTEGRRTCVTNQNGEVYSWRYDPLGRVLERKGFDGSVARFERNDEGEVTVVRRANGATILREYDAAGRVKTESAYYEHDAASGEAPLKSEFTRDWRGGLMRAVSPGCVVEFERDPAGRLVRERQNECELEYSYDRTSRLIRRELKAGPWGPVQFRYNAGGLLAAVLDKAGELETLTYARSGLLAERRMRGGTCERVQYDEQQRVLTQYIDRNRALIVSRRYQFDPRHNLTELADTTRGMRQFKYDSALRLVAVSANGAVTDRFAYDRAGNIIAHNSDARQYDAGSRLASRDGVKYEYDTAGNQTVEVQASERWERTYDPYGKLLRLYRDGALVAEYVYDALNRRVKKNLADGSTITYVWSGRTLAGINEKAGSHSKTTEMLLGGPDRVPMAFHRDGRTQHYLCDHIGTPQEIIDETSGVRWRAQYAPYGAAKVDSDAHLAGQTVRFPGQLADAESGLCYNFHRYYDPTQARYLTQDPAGIDAGLNLYDYPRDPINWSDPLGLSCPNPKLIAENDEMGWQIHEHDDGTQILTADCSKAFATPKPDGLRDTVAVGDQNANNPPEACLGADDRVIVMEGTHRSVAAARGQQMPPDPDNPALGGVPGQPGYMRYEYAKDCNDPDQEGVPLSSLTYPPGYPHKLD